MRRFGLVCLPLCGMLFVMSSAIASPQFPSGALALETQLLTKQTADGKAFISTEAGNEATGHFISEDMPRSAARKFGASGSEVSEVAFLILMQAARDADANVNELVGGVQSAEASRQDVRQQEMTSTGIAGAQNAQLSTSERTAEKEQGSAFLSLLPSSDGSNKISEALTPHAGPAPTTTMNLQDAMDRESQIEDLLNQAMKRVTQPT
jgi:hypothetical protein